jgi:tRNA modification GTPase
MSSEDTIFALSSAPGRAGVAVVRLSGSRAGAALEARGGGALPSPRVASLRRLVDPARGQPLDRALVLWFPAPHSFTGEDVVEFHLHGGRAVVAAVVEALSGLAGLRAAEAGEFTRRAFDGGKLDLAEVEGLADLINAETEAQRRQALRQMEGALSALTETWSRSLQRTLAHMEAAIDFPDEQLPAEILAGVTSEIREVEEAITRQLADAGRGERLRHGLQVAIIGPPNAGKSSLLNALARREAAIVSETAGTTRDVIEVHLDLAGYPVTLADTAGLRDPDRGREASANHSIEREGIKRARDRAAAADLKLAVFDLLEWPALDPQTRRMLDGDSLVVLNKRDRVEAAAWSIEGISTGDTFPLSALTGAGMDQLLSRLESEVVARLGTAGAEPAITRARHLGALEACGAALRRAGAAAQAELAAEDLRLALRALGRITGQVGVEDILDIVFRDFCIGK